MYDNLKSLGITNPEEIDRYSLRQEANNDILKIYFQKDKGEFFAKSVKFKYPRQRKTVVADGIGQGYKEVQEISPNLRYVIDELDQICQRDRTEVDLKRKILDDLRHLESVVANKITEIEADLEKLTRTEAVCCRMAASRALSGLQVHPRRPDKRSAIRQSINAAHPVCCRMATSYAISGLQVHPRRPDKRSAIRQLINAAHPVATLRTAAADRQSCLNPARSIPRFDSVGTPAYYGE